MSARLRITTIGTAWLALVWLCAQRVEAARPLNYPPPGLNYSVSFAPRGTQTALQQSSATLAGDGSGKLLGDPSYLEPEAEIVMSLPSGGWLGQDLSLYLECVDMGPEGVRAGRRFFALFDGDSVKIDSSETYTEILGGQRRGLDNVTLGGVDAAGTAFQVRGKFFDGRAGVFHTQLDGGGYTGAGLYLMAGTFDLLRKDTPWDGNSTWQACTHSGRFTITWRAEGDSLSVDVEDELRGEAVPFSPYIDTGGWGFVPPGLTAKQFNDEWGVNWNGASNVETPPELRKLLLVKHLAADNSAEFCLYVDGQYWNFFREGGIAMPAPGTLMTVVTAWGEWNQPLTEFTQYPDPVYIRDCWKIEAKAPALDPGSRDNVYAGDIDESGRVDVFDLISLLKVMANPLEQSGRARRIADTDGSGKVDVFDLLALLKVLGGSRAPAPISLAPPSGIFSLSGTVTLAGAGLRCVSLHLSGPGGLELSQVTGQDGTFLFSSLPEGKFSLLPVRSGYEFSPSVQAVSISGTDASGVTFTASEQSGAPAPGDTLSIQGLTLVTVPAGDFTMGQPGVAVPTHSVHLPSFQVGALEVTQAQYQAVLGESPSAFAGNPDNPVESVSWYEAARFCNRLSELAGLTPCYDPGTWECDYTRKGFRLPTEAEWEYACRARSVTNFFPGCDVTDLEKVGWSGEDSLSGATHPAAQKVPNLWGLYDTHGNVAEWVNDWLGDYPDTEQDAPRGPSAGALKVTRGGSYSSDAWHCRSAARLPLDPLQKNPRTGFRVARTY